MKDLKTASPLYSLEREDTHDIKLRLCMLRAKHEANLARSLALLVGHSKFRYDKETRIALKEQNDYWSTEIDVINFKLSLLDSV